MVKRWVNVNPTQICQNYIPYIPLKKKSQSKGSSHYYILLIDSVLVIPVVMADVCQHWKDILGETLSSLVFEGDTNCLRALKFDPK